MLDIIDFRETLLKGASVERIESRDVSLLLLCLKNGITDNVTKKQWCFSMLKELISKNANLNFVTQDQETPINFCIANYDDNKFVELLVTAGANICQVTNGESALSLAVKRKNYELIKLLLENGADLSVNSALTKAIAIGDENAIKVLIDSAPKIIDFKNNLHLSHAARQGLLESVQLILQMFKDDTNFALDLKNKALYEAVETNHLEIIKLLLQNRAELKYSPDANKPTTFTKLVQNQNFKAIGYMFGNEALLGKLKKCLKKEHILTAIANYDLRTVRLLTSIAPIDMLIPVVEKTKDLSQNDKDMKALQRYIMISLEVRYNYYSIRK